MNTYIAQIELDETRPNGATHCRVTSVDYNKEKIQFKAGYFSEDEEPAWIEVESARADIASGLTGELLSESTNTQREALKASIQGGY